MNTLAHHALSLNWFDYFIIAVIVISTLISLIRGFVSEAVSLLTWILAAIIAFKFTSDLSRLFENLIHNPSVRMLVSFLILFFIILIIGSILNHFIGIFVRGTGLSGTNRILGMVFGFARGVLLIAIIVLFAKLTSIIRTPWWQTSHLVPYFQGLADWLQHLIPVQLNHVSHYFAHPKHGSL